MRAGSLAKYLTTLDEWVQGKLAKYDGGDAASRAAIDAKHPGGRDAYEEHLKYTVIHKYEAEAAKKGPRAPTIEAVTEALVAATEALSTGGALVGDDAATAVEAVATAAAADAAAAAAAANTAAADNTDGAAAAAPRAEEPPTATHATSGEAALVDDVLDVA